MLRIGLTGGIGAGKSAVSARLAARGAVIVDSDLIAREVVAPGSEGLRAVVAEFGEGVLGPDGSLDRPALGLLVFADPARLAALNAIVHPLVRARSAELEAAAGPEDLVVHDVPLLAENGLAPLYDLVIVVDTADEVRIDRLVRLRGITEEEARSRMAAQASREQRLAIADLVIDNGGTEEQLDAKVAEVWAQLKERQAAGK
ncbi:dephospho-CoA kinase [Kitasatospora sp. MMS16-BH015]|uniref:dephospho-CoA kinase n=1 Tax=Kitasatospora sp. MMS16-BH015 TaxID=2018025 RepID=UPI000CA13996|nr:dephospho-CoA kinase [Kitasatospora sp. MMS16-BH015]AUG76587.1 dephospho-CoA kinase [Kitasatospora sp. MMS16-BH015]